jgi:hypothetical protein
MPTCVVVLANGTIEATRLALDSLGVGSRQFGSGSRHPSHSWYWLRRQDNHAALFVARLMCLVIHKRRQSSHAQAHPLLLRYIACLPRIQCVGRLWAIP